MLRGGNIVAGGAALASLAACGGGSEIYPQPTTPPESTPAVVGQVPVLECAIPNTFTLNTDPYGNPDPITCGVAELLREQIASGQEMRMIKVRLPVKEIGACIVNPLLFGAGEHFMAFARPHPDGSETPQVTAFSVTEDADPDSVPQREVVLRPSEDGDYYIAETGGQWSVIAATVNMKNCES